MKAINEQKYPGTKLPAMDALNISPSGLSTTYGQLGYTHNEINANEFCTGFTPGRVESAKEFEGNFFLTDYGIRTRGRVNQWNVWRSSDYHLSYVVPQDKNPLFRHSGVAFIIAEALSEN